MSEGFISEFEAESSFPNFGEFKHISTDFNSMIFPQFQFPIFFWWTKALEGNITRSVLRFGLPLRPGRAPLRPARG
jgi:hypothetical protein